MDYDTVRAQLLLPNMQPSARRAWLKLGAGVLGLAVLEILWRFTPLAELVKLPMLLSYAERLRDHPAAPLAVIGAFCVANLILVPINLMVVVTVRARAHRLPRGGAHRTHTSGIRSPAHPRPHRAVTPGKGQLNTNALT